MMIKWYIVLIALIIVTAIAFTLSFTVEGNHSLGLSPCTVTNTKDYVC